MAFIDWTLAFSVGAPVLDDQHKLLIALINELHATILQRGTEEELQRIFQELILYTESHFKCEEGLLRQACYPRLVAHHLLHVEFIDQGRRLYDELLAGKSTVSMDLLVALKKWWNGHILGTDRQYVSYLNATSGRLPPGDETSALPAGG
jgi:hemerythrin-like metal-binding protein